MPRGADILVDIQVGVCNLCICKGWNSSQLSQTTRTAPTLCDTCITYPQLLKSIPKECLSVRDRRILDSPKEEDGNAQEDAAARGKTNMAADQRAPQEPRAHVHAQRLMEGAGEGALHLHQKGCTCRPMLKRQSSVRQRNAQTDPVDFEFRLSVEVVPAWTSRTASEAGHVRQWQDLMMVGAAAFANMHRGYVCQRAANQLAA